MSDSLDLKHFVPSLVPPEGLGILVLFRLIEESVPDFFRPDRTVLVSRAPGRLDVMGGLADYAGSLVLQLPTAEAAAVAVQARDDDLVRLWSPSRGGARSELLSVRLADLGLPDAPLPFDQARAFLLAAPPDRWAARVLGAFLVLAVGHGVRPQHGCELLLHSDVPPGRGAGASGAVEVAVLHALSALYRVGLGGLELATAAAAVEREFGGELPGVTDQVTAALGEADELLALRLQPGQIVDGIPVPQELEFVGLDSGVRAADDRIAREFRAGAFAGARMLADLRGLPVRRTGDLVTADDPEWGGRLAGCPAATFRERFQPALPEWLRGAEFTRRFGGHADPSAPIEPEATYKVRAATAHAIEENARVERFAALLRGPIDAAVRAELGALMAASHAAYTAAGLASEATDLLVREAEQRRASGAPLVGAKASGRGGGGTVVLLGERGKVWYEALRLKKALLTATGHSAYVFRWSSPGAVSFGGIELRPRAGNRS